MKESLNKLNAAQKKAVTAKEGPVLVVAGAGSGKTRVLTYRIAYLIYNGVSSDQILAVTFTNKAAQEMRERVEHMLREHGKHIKTPPFIGTFHKLGLTILRAHGERVGLRKGFTVFDEEDTRKLLEDVLEAEQIDTQVNSRGVRETISSLKTELITPAEYELRVSSYKEGVIARAYHAYERALRKNNGADFDDLITLPARLFLQCADVLQGYHRTYTHLFVDEYQDTNLAQYVLMNLLGKQSRNIFVVGDMDQSIYGWRGADYRNLVRFEMDYPDHQAVYLEENYRSTRTIVEAGAHVISHNASRKDTRLWTGNHEGDKVKVVVLYDEKQEAQFIADTVGRGRIPRASIAVLYRTNAQSRAIEAALLRAAIPYTLIGGVRFYERREVKDILAYLRFLANPSEIFSMRRILNVPKRGLSGVQKNPLLDEFIDPETLTLTSHAVLPTRQKKSLEDFLVRMRMLREKIIPLSLLEAIRVLTKEIGYKEYLLEDEHGEERWENVLEMLTIAQEYQPHGTFLESVPRFLEETSLGTHQEVKEDLQAVNLMTIHAAKGLEFDTIFITGLEEGVFPGRKAETLERELEEERRLAYVGITRAKKRLYLLFARTRTLFGMTKENPPSRFLAEIPENLVEFMDRAGEVLDDYKDPEWELEGEF